MSLAYNDNPRVTGDYVWITCDDTAGRRSRAAHIGHERRRYQAEHGVTLTLLAKSYSETPGFLHRSSFRYRIRPAANYLDRNRDRLYGPAATSRGSE